MLTSTPPFRPRSQDRDPHGDHREPPGEDPGGYYGQRALHGHQEVEGWQGWIRVLPVRAVARHSPPHLRKSRPGPKIDTSTTFFLTPVIGRIMAVSVAMAAQSRKNVDGYFRRFGPPTDC